MIRRKLHAVHQQLALVERTEIGRKRIAKVDGAEQFIVDGIGDGHSVRVLLGGIDASRTRHISRTIYTDFVVRSRLSLKRIIRKAHSPLSWLQGAKGLIS
jgi:hypothetical protein